MNNQQVIEIEENIAGAIEVAKHAFEHHDVDKGNIMNVAFCGAPGCGKTEGGRQAATELGFAFHEANPTVKDPTDFKGVFGLHDGEAKVYPLPDLKKMINATEPLVVCLDDISWAVQGVQAPSLQLTQSREIDGVPISKHVRFMITSNRAQDGRGSTVMAPLVNRFCFIKVKFDIEAWCRWASKNNMPPMLIAFVRSYHDDIVKAIDTFKMTTEVTPFCSARSLANLGVWYRTGCRRLSVYQGCIGTGLAIQFAGYDDLYLKIKDLPQQIIKNPNTAPVPQEEHVLYAISAKLGRMAKDDNFDIIYEYANRLPSAYRGLIVNDAITHKPDLKQSAVYINWFTQNANRNVI